MEEGRGGLFVCSRSSCATEVVLSRLVEKRTAPQRLPDCLIGGVGLAPLQTVKESPGGLCSGLQGNMVVSDGHTGSPPSADCDCSRALVFCRLPHFSCTFPPLGGVAGTVVIFVL